MSKREKVFCGIGLALIGAAVLLFLPEASTAGILFCAWGALALVPSKRRTKS